MKKTLIFFFCAALAIPAAAQSWEQALQFSENNYGGSARSMAMGNALTAVGGDPGSIGLNPAGSSVAGYSQFFISPGLSITSNVAQGVTPEGYSDPVGLADRVTSGYTRFKLPNVGFTINMNTGRKTGLKRVSVGFLHNSTNDFTDRMESAGINFGKHSYAGSLASLAQGYSTDVMGKADWYAEGAGNQPQWNSMVGFRCGMFDLVDGKYLAVTDLFNTSGEPEAAAQLYQNYGFQSRGYKQDIILNMSANFVDKFYIGMNLGITSLNYVETQFWEERPNGAFPPIHYTDGTVATFNSLLMNRRYEAKGSGVYFKAGFLWRPVAGLRLAAAVQTPTLVNMTGRCSWYGETNFTGQYFPSRKSPEDEWLYTLTMPFRFNVGVAYAIGQFGVLSVDYEGVDYRHSRYGGRSEYNEYSSGAYSNENADIQDALGFAHNIRAGFEFKPSEALAIRVGYNFSTGGQRNWLDWSDGSLTLVPLSDQERADQCKHAVSFGGGYSFGHFYADLAVRLRFLPSVYYKPYDHYTYTPGGTYDYVDKYVDVTKETPLVRARTTGIDTVLSFGWRF